jgi:hypothetical protein
MPYDPKVEATGNSNNKELQILTSKWNNLITDVPEIVIVFWYSLR